LTHEKNYWSSWILGSHLCDRFIKEGYFVIGMDNLITGDLKNIEHLFKLENFEFYHHDITKFVHVPSWIIFFILLRQQVLLII
jgi:dTDP-glucose 4,6-dehydratase